MRIKVKFFAGLREAMGCAELDLDIPEGQTLNDVWAGIAARKVLPSEVLMAVNMDYAQADVEIKEGDEIAFFPPVTGG